MALFPILVGVLASVKERSALDRRAWTRNTGRRYQQSYLYPTSAPVANAPVDIFSLH